MQRNIASAEPLLRRSSLGQLRRQSSHPMQRPFSVLVVGSFAYLYLLGGSCCGRQRHAALGLSMVRRSPCGHDSMQWVQSSPQRLTSSLSASQRLEYLYTASFLTLSFSALDLACNSLFFDVSFLCSFNFVSLSFDSVKAVLVSDFSRRSSMEEHLHLVSGD